MSESVAIEFVRYRTPGGAPTCSLNVEKSEFCRFLGVMSFGSKSVCMLGEQVDMQHGAGGFIEPHRGCDLWAKA